MRKNIACLTTFVAVGIFLFVATGSLAQEVDDLETGWIEPLTKEQVEQRCFKPYTGPTETGVDTSTMQGKVLCGYQGWFNCAGDGADRNWFHYGIGGRRIFSAESCSIDLWPDLSEFDDDEKFPTPFKHKDGSVANLFSSWKKKTVLRHFKWMADYGLDGVLVQRFQGMTTTGPHEKYLKAYRHTNVVLNHCREGANRYGRTFAVMYDISFGKNDLEQIKRDWHNLFNKMRITESDAYLRHKGKPVLGLWGYGFSHRGWDTQAVKDFFKLLREDPEFGPVTILVGVPWGWRMDDHALLNPATPPEAFEWPDIISPWTVAPPKDKPELEGYNTWVRDFDIDWCKKFGKDYLPVAAPGFSWHNMKNNTPLGMVPRRKGQLLAWQLLLMKDVGASMVYVAMFDEIDEGTAIFKCTNDPPNNEHCQFLDYEGLDSDYYLKQVGDAAQMYRGEMTTEDFRKKYAPSDATNR